MLGQRFPLVLTSDKSPPGVMARGYETRNRLIGSVVNFAGGRAFWSKLADRSGGESLVDTAGFMVWVTG